jgi:hypothetical protein
VRVECDRDPPCLKGGSATHNSALEGSVRVLFGSRRASRAGAPSTRSLASS